MTENQKFAGNPVMTSLPAYVQDNVDELIAKSAIGARTLTYIQIQTGVKGDAHINILSTDVKFKQNAEECGFNPEGTQGINQRLIKTGIVAVNMEYCPKNMLKKYNESKLSIIAGRENLPFEEKFVADVVKDVKDKLDILIWQGNTGSMDQNLKPFDGFIKILKEDEAVIDVPITHDTPKMTAVTNVLMKIPANLLRYDDVRIACSPSFLRDYQQELVKANLYHFAPAEDLDEFQIPGSKVKLIALEGLETKPSAEAYLIGGRLSNFVYGTDLEGGEEEFKLWYSDDQQKFRLKIEFNGGVQVVFPDEVVLGEIATA